MPWTCTLAHHLSPCACSSAVRAFRRSSKGWEFDYRLGQRNRFLERFSLTNVQVSSLLMMVVNTLFSNNLFRLFENDIWSETFHSIRFHSTANKNIFPYQEFIRKPRFQTKKCDSEMTYSNVLLCVPFANLSSLVRNQIHIAALNHWLKNKGGKTDLERHKRIFQIVITTTDALVLISHCSLFLIIAIALEDSFLVFNSFPHNFPTSVAPVKYSLFAFPLIL